MWNALNNASRSTCKNMWVQIEQAVQTLDIHYKYKKGPHSCFCIRYSPLCLSSATWHHNTWPYLLGLPSILRMEAEKAWNKAWSYNSTFVWNVRKKKKTCLENIFSFGLVSSLMPRPPCPCGEHLVVWFEFLVTSHARQMHNYCAKNAISSACCLIVV